MVFRRRDQRCCFLVAFVSMVIVLSFTVGSQYLEPHLGDISLPGINVPGWLRPDRPGPISDEFFDEEYIQEPNTKTSTAPKTSSTGTIRPAILGPNDVGVETTIPEGAYTQGFTVMDNLYMRDGTFFVLTSDASKFPSRPDMIARPVTKEEGVDLAPTDQDLQFLEPSTEALGGRAIRITGLSVIVYDPPSTMNNFYSWWGEIVLGAWRVYSKIGQEVNNSTASSLSLPSRFILPVVSKGAWRDDARITGPLMSAGFPHASVEESDYWQDFAKLNSTVIFERVILVSREAASRHPSTTQWGKMITGTMQLAVPDGFWGPIRTMVVRNVLGYLPLLNEAGVVVGPPEAGLSTKPVVTYISRQESERRLEEKDHHGLIDALRALEQEGICEVHVLAMEHASLVEQINLAARSTILLGVHGNQLTHQLWMPPSPMSTVLEIVWPKAYVFDHEIISRNMGHKHYAVWNDSLVDPKGSYYEGIMYGDEFNSNAIPVYGPEVAELIKLRLSS
ncbi:hypothetical protein BDZ97DRAFT_2040215 [Flammula alnicola]|nr:hypothetical protein BDZ97DRAFT_2040215 [Flammula alnicola]